MSKQNVVNLIVKVVFLIDFVMCVSGGFWQTRTADHSVMSGGL